jgi:Fe-S cluster assembly scaffold protein SufB
MGIGEPSASEQNSDGAATGSGQESYRQTERIKQHGAESRSEQRRDEKD